ncbi:MAG: AsmA family protein [Steroidobacteraceae bacterium]
MLPSVASAFQRWLKWPLLVLAALLVLLLALVTGTAALVDAGYFHEPIRKMLVAKAQRDIEVGHVETRLLSWHPSLTAERVVIHNPPWMPAGILAAIDRASLTLATPTLAEPLRFRHLELQGATFNLLRDASGKANWRATSGRMSRKGPPLMASLAVRDAELHLRDARRHLIFDGKLSAVGSGADNLRIDASGTLNTRPATVSVVADPLAAARRDTPYRFRFDARSSGATVSGHGALARPFDMRRLQSTLAASGDDLKDLYFLVGLNFPDTGPFRASGELQRIGLEFRFTAVQGKTGGTDIAGTALVDSTGERARFTADLRSTRLQLADFGRKAAHRAPQGKKGPRLMPDTPLRLDALRRADSLVNYRARRVALGKLELNTVAATVKVDRGVLTVAPASAKFADGKVTAQWKFDGSTDIAATALTMDLDGLQLSQFGRNGGPPPLRGLLRAKVRLSGKGRSVHQLAAGADGSMVAILPRGEIRASLAEMGGIDFRALGLMLSGKQTMTTLRCGVVALDLDDGKLTSKALVIDTAPVLITGTGTMDLESEALDFEFRGHPKNVRLRLRTSVAVQGTLADPAIGLKGRRSLAQAGAGVALGVLLTPLAAIAAFIDPGRAQDADCAALIKSNGG